MFIYVYMYIYMTNIFKYWVITKEDKIRCVTTVKGSMRYTDAQYSSP